jgi:putative FmdB family regulatory protein
MPTYDYECTKCGYAFEKSQKMTDKPLVKCPKCQGKVKRLIGSGSGFIFKGAGFYATDYKKKTDTKSREEKPAPQALPKTCPKLKEGCDGCKANT